MSNSDRRADDILPRLLAALFIMLFPSCSSWHVEEAGEGPGGRAKVRITSRSIPSPLEMTAVAEDVAEGRGVIFYVGGMKLEKAGFAEAGPPTKIDSLGAFLEMSAAASPRSGGQLVHFRGEHLPEAYWAASEEWVKQHWDATYVNIYSFVCSDGLLVQRVRDSAPPPESPGRPPAREYPGGGAVKGTWQCVGRAAVQKPSRSFGQAVRSACGTRCHEVPLCRRPPWFQGVGRGCSGLPSTRTRAGRRPCDGCLGRRTRG